MLESEAEDGNPGFQQEPGQSQMNRANSLLLEGLELDENNQQV